jgi:hypothetical protein
MNYHVGVASHNDTRYVASANAYVVNGLYHTHHNFGSFSKADVNNEFFEF